MTRARARWLALLREPWLVYAIGVVLFSALSLFQWPIVAGDTDLWYHLTGGRYILEHRELPHDSFFSFLWPPRPWVDYFWGFQVFVYALHQWGGYPALIAFRGAIYLATAALILRLLLTGRDRQTPVPWLVFLALSACLFLLPRWLGVRPHLFTYLFIVAFIWILERRPRAAWGLPALGVVWCNVHGVVYPVMLLLLGAYVLEALVHRLQGQAALARHHRMILLPAVATMATVFLTPHGARLLAVPFISTAGASRYIAELQPYRLYELFSYAITFMTPAHLTIFNAFFLVLCVAILLAWRRRPLRVSHLIMAAGGLALLGRGVRFTCECLLLALPLVRATPLIPTTHLARRVARPVYVAGAALLLLLPLNFVMGVFHGRPRSPVSDRRLPVGIAAFLERVGPGGTLLNGPNSGGYLQWRLYPRYRIFMDMQIPFLFTDEDMVLAQQVFANPTAFGTFSRTYRPTFVSVPNGSKEFVKVITAFPDYVLVFFDDVEVLYVDRAQAPAIAQRYRLAALDPFTLVEKDIEELLEETEDRGPLLAELHQVLAVDPRGALANQLAGEIFNDEQAYGRALPHAEAMIRTYPEDAAGYRIQGDALKGLRRFEAAIAAYQAAMGRSSPSSRPRLYEKIGLVQFARGDYAAAYRLLNAYVDRFSSETSVETLFSLGSSARLAGHPREAERVLTSLAAHTVSPDDPVWAERLRQELALLGADRGKGVW